MLEVSKGAVRSFAHRNFAPMNTTESAGENVRPPSLLTDLPVENWLPPIGLPRNGYRVRYATSPTAMWAMGRLLGTIPIGFASGQVQKRKVTTPVIRWWLGGFGFSLPSDHSEYSHCSDIFVKTLRATRGGAGLCGLPSNSLRLVHAQRFALALELSSLLVNDPDGMGYAEVFADVFGLWRVRKASDIIGLCLKIVVPYPYLNFHFKYSNASAVEVDGFVLAAMRGADVPAHSFVSAPHTHTDLALQGMVAHCREEWRIGT